MHVRLEAKIKIIVELDLELPRTKSNSSLLDYVKVRLQKWNVIKYMSMFKEQPQKCS